MVKIEDQREKERVHGEKGEWRLNEKWVVGRAGGRGKRVR